MSIKTRDYERPKRVGRPRNVPIIDNLIETIMPPTPDQYNGAKLDMLYLLGPVIKPCALCGWPRIQETIMHIACNKCKGKKIK